MNLHLESSFDKFVNRNDLVNIHRFERILRKKEILLHIHRTQDTLYLQHFEVVDVLMLQLRVELDLLEHHRAGEEHVHELTIDGASAKLLNLGVLGAEAVVDPGQHVVSG